jgi:hypothetical protein
MGHLNSRRDLAREQALMWKPKLPFSASGLSTSADIVEARLHAMILHSQ